MKVGESHSQIVPFHKYECDDEKKNWWTARERAQVVGAELASLHSDDDVEAANAACSSV